MRSNSRGDIIALWMRGYLRAIPTSKLGLLWLGLFFYSIVVPTSIAWERGFVMGFNFCFLIGALVIATKIAYDFVQCHLWRKVLLVCRIDGVECGRYRLVLPPGFDTYEEVQKQLKGQI